jgi:NADPH-dependent 2,4-dienoyl-CoA reductase/sulfur reductase-like enzyme
MRLRIDTRAVAIDVAGRRVQVRTPSGVREWLGYEELVVGTGARPAVPAMTGVGGPDGLGPAEACTFCTPSGTHMT